MHVKNESKSGHTFFSNIYVHVCVIVIVCYIPRNEVGGGWGGGGGGGGGGVYWIHAVRPSVRPPSVSGW